MHIFYEENKNVVLLSPNIFSHLSTFSFLSPALILVLDTSCRNSLGHMPTYYSVSLRISLQLLPLWSFSFLLYITSLPPPSLPPSLPLSLLSTVNPSLNISAKPTKIHLENTALFPHPHPPVIQATLSMVLRANTVHSVHSAKDRGGGGDDMDKRKILLYLQYLFNENCEAT